MENIPLPSGIEFKKSDKPHTAVLTVEPCYPGYGITIGNVLRRVLLSSLPGAAVIAVKIKGAEHEFSTIPNVQEDVINIILNSRAISLSYDQGKILQKNTFF